MSELNEATPLFEVVANSAAIVIVEPLAIVSIPSPVKNSKVPPRETEPEVELSSVNEIALFANLAFVTFPFEILAVVTAFDANCVAETPPSLIYNSSEVTPIVVSSYLTSKVLPVFPKASPALI